ncbi:MAG: DUF368 domain-containing protein [Nanobdellota archaeon]
MTKSYKKNIIILLKGILMGICDLIPGISGGTIALISGIYERLIKAIKGVISKEFLITALSLFDIKKFSKKKKELSKFDLQFLIILGLGIISAILIFSGIIEYLLNKQFIYTMTFFIGLIISSIKLIYNKIESKSGYLFILPGILIGLGLSFLIPLEPKINLFYTFLSGFFAINAMILPGISGAYILLIMGSYEFMLKVLHNLTQKINYFLIFALGAILGITISTRIINYILKRWHSQTLFFLMGIVIGSLAIPLKKISPEITSNNLPFIIIFFLLGLIVTILIKIMEKSINKKSDKIN